MPSKKKKGSGYPMKGPRREYGFIVYGNSNSANAYKVYTVSVAVKSIEDGKTILRSFETIEVDSSVCVTGPATRLYATIMNSMEEEYGYCKYIKEKELVEQKKKKEREAKKLSAQQKKEAAAKKIKDDLSKAKPLRRLEV